jgi:hypothetical protein
MGTIVHQAIIVTSWNEEVILKGYYKARELFGSGLSGIIPARVNGYMSFMIAPSGSKEAWPTNTEHNDACCAFVAWMKAHNTAAAGGRIDWIVTAYGGDYPEDARIISHSA